jgi:hypothetical protein
MGNPLRGGLRHQEAYSQSRSEFLKNTDIVGVSE